MLTRREFLKLASTTLAGLTLSELLLPDFYRIFAGAAPQERVPVVYLEVCTCSGDIMSFMNVVNPDLAEVMFRIIDLRFQNTLMPAQGEQALALLEEARERWAGRYILAVEGTVPVRFAGRASVVAGRRGKFITGLEAVRLLAERARAVVANGVCASFGGVYAAHPNPTGGKSVQAILDRPVINVPGCPSHPDWFLGTIYHLVRFGTPPLDAYGRPLLFYGTRVHDRCPRRQAFEDGIFAEKPGEYGCLYKIGCKGPVSFCDAPVRQWNGYYTWAVESNAPCIGCTQPDYPDRMMPFFEHLPDLPLPGVKASTRTAALAVGGALATGIGLHLTGSLLTGRLVSHLRQELTGGEEVPRPGELQPEQPGPAPDFGSAPPLASPEPVPGAPSPPPSGWVPSPVPPKPPPPERMRRPRPWREWRRRKKEQKEEGEEHGDQN